MKIIKDMASMQGQIEQNEDGQMIIHFVTESLTPAGQAKLTHLLNELGMVVRGVLIVADML